MMERSSERPDGSDLDNVFRSLQHPIRRIILAELQRSTKLDISELQLIVETEIQEVQGIPIELRHKHLPILEETGYVSWEEDESVERGANFETIEPVLNIWEDHGDELPGEWL